MLEIIINDTLTVILYDSNFFDVSANSMSMLRCFVFLNDRHKDINNFCYKLV